LKVTIWIMPDNSSSGEFEDLCLKALAGHPFVPCLGPLENCVKQQKVKTGKGAKARLYTVLAWLDPPGRRVDQCNDAQISQMDLSVFDPIVRDFFSLL
jgi:hypothetical protein